MNGSVWTRLRERSALRIGKNALARLSAQVWAKILSVALVALVARYETPDALGRYVLVITMTGIAVAATDLGLNTLLTREAARESDQQRRRELLGTVLPIKVGLSIAGAAALVAVSAAAPFPEATKRLIPLTSLLLLPEGVTGALRSFVNARQRMEVSGLIDMAVRLIALVGSLPVLAAGLGVAGVLGCTVGASIVGVLLYYLILRRWRDSPRFRLAPAVWRAYLAESYPFAATAIIAMVYTRMDLVLLGLLQGETAAGWYGAAYKLWESIGLLPASLLDAMFPEMSRLSGDLDGLESLRHLFRTSARTGLAAGLLIAAGGIAAASLLVSLIYGTNETYAPLVLPFRLLVSATPAMFLYLLGGHILYTLGKQRQVTLAMLATGTANVMLNLLVIPRWSYLGTAIVALLSNWLLWALLYPRARRVLNSSGNERCPKTT